MLTALLFASVASTITQVAPEPIVLDGRFDDWRAVPVVLDDPADAPDAVVDLGELRLSHDGQFVHLLVELRRPVNVQRLAGTIQLLLDGDGDPATGATVEGLPGTDVIVELSPRTDGRPRSGVGLLSTSVAEPLSPHDAGLAYAPTYAGDRFELRMKRAAELPDTPPFLAGDRFSGKLLFLDSRGQVADRTDPFTHALGPVSSDPVQQRSNPLARSKGTDVRVVSWNVEFSGVLSRPEHFGRVLRALEPDLILFQELRDADTAAMLIEFLDRWLPAKGTRPWSVVLGRGGGNLRCAVASRRDLVPSVLLELVPYPDVPQRSIRVAAGELSSNRKTALALSVHLMCCGFAGSFEDRSRQVEADTIRRSVAAAMAAGRSDALVIGGDLNLVGSRHPLDILTDGLDAGGAALAIADPLQLDGRSNATWESPQQPFAPGRLDFLLYADSALELLGCFVLDTADLSQRWLGHHGLEAGDTSTASDHLPVVADFRWR